MLMGSHNGLSLGAGAPIPNPSPPPTGRGFKRRLGDSG